MKPWNPDEKPNYENKRDFAEEFYHNFLVLRDRYKRDKQAPESKYSQTFFTQIRARADVLVQMKNILDADLTEKCWNFGKFVDELKVEKFDKGIEVNDADIDVADEILNYLIMELSKKYGKKL